ncbi:MAG: IS66-like element ISRfsp1 family transposase, partial [Pseudonocardiaceae bacterium]
MSEAGSQCPSYDELLAVVTGVPALAARVALLGMENDDLRAGNAALRAENAALKRKLGTDSTNSSTPPSQDS